MSASAIGPQFGRSCPDCASRGSASTSRAVGKKKKGPQTAESSNDGSPERFPRAPRLRVGRGLAFPRAALDPVAPAQARPSPIHSEAQSSFFTPQKKTLLIHVSISHPLVLHKPAGSACPRLRRRVCPAVPHAWRWGEAQTKRRSSFSWSLSSASKLPALRMASSSPRPGIAVEMAVVTVEGLAERPDFVG